MGNSTKASHRARSSLAMTRCAVVLAVAFGAACVSVEASRIRKGVYVVHVRGNAIGGQGQAIKEAHERANRLCPDGYDVEDRASDSSSAFIATTYGVQQIKKPEITLVVRCSQPESPAAVPVPVSPTPTLARWWCVTYGAGRLGACYRNPSMCETRRQASLQIDAATSACAPRGTASCFGIAFPNTEGSDDSCHPSFAACNEQRDYTLGHPDQATALTMCRDLD